MKIRQWLNKLPKREREEAIREWRKRDRRAWPNVDVVSLSQALNRAFTWGTTRWGADRWSAIYGRELGKENAAKPAPKKKYIIRLTSDSPIKVEVQDE